MLWLLDTANRIRLKIINKKFNIEELTEVPEWAGDMCMNDGHKYSEVHNRGWLQWCLSYNLSGKPQDRQHFYAIYDRNKQPAGFFFTKIRLLEDVGKYGSFLHGVLCEWASNNPELTEDDINLLAFGSMPRECYHFTTVTVDSTVEKNLHKMGFLRHGSQQMGYKDKLGKYPDMKDMSNWRIRFGCCNSIVF